MRKYLLSIPMILLLLVGVASAATIGQPIDNFSLTDLDNNTHRASDYRGKVLVIAAFGFN